MSNQDEINRVWEVIEKVGVCMMTTRFSNGLGHDRLKRGLTYKSVIWFLTDRRAAKDDEIKAFPEICLTFVYPSQKIYLSISGEASASRDTKRARSLWNENNRFGGPADQTIQMCR